MGNLRHSSISGPIELISLDDDEYRIEFRIKPHDLELDREFRDIASHLQGVRTVEGTIGILNLSLTMPAAEVKGRLIEALRSTAHFTISELNLAKQDLQIV